MWSETMMRVGLEVEGWSGDEATAGRSRRVGKKWLDAWEERQRVGDGGGVEDGWGWVGMRYGRVWRGLILGTLSSMST